MRKTIIRATREQRKVIFRDVFIFQFKLFLDGAKDIVLSPLSIVAALADVVWPTDRVGKRFYHVMLIGERLDKWLNLFGAAEHADAGEDGLFGASRAGTNSMLGRLETIVTGREEQGPQTRKEFDNHPLDWEPVDHARKFEEFDRELKRPPSGGAADDRVAAAGAADDDHATDALGREELNHDLFGQPDP